MMLRRRQTGGWCETRGVLGESSPSDEATRAVVDVQTTKIQGFPGALNSTENQPAESPVKKGKKKKNADVFFELITAQEETWCPYQIDFICVFHGN